MPGNCVVSRCADENTATVPIAALLAGAPFLPYLITDKVVAPPQLHHCYSEKLALMPNCYFVNDYKRCHRDVLNKAALPRRGEFGLPDDKIIFSCSNQLYKYDPDTFKTWCNILKRVPDR
eukprot:GHUV01042361.1.p2 GENE.GHUV01042361.1~~GHUV01042361.1.p2  ORF type:complete len:120 (-),score=30.44 GHUV01042361.1:603-962(-)